MYTHIQEGGDQDMFMKISLSLSLSLSLLTTVQNLPTPVSNYHIYGVSDQLAIIHWIVPRIAYTPETYYIQYRAISEDGSGTMFVSPTIMGTEDLSARNVEYDVVLEGLDSGTFYVANIVANNTIGGQPSMDIRFTTSPLGEGL